MFGVGVNSEQRQTMWRREVIGDRAAIDTVYMAGAISAVRIQGGDTHHCIFRTEYDMRRFKKHLDVAVWN